MIECNATRFASNICCVTPPFVTNVVCCFRVFPSFLFFCSSFAIALFFLSSSLFLFLHSSFSFNFTNFVCHFFHFLFLFLLPSQSFFLPSSSFLFCASITRSALLDPQGFKIGRRHVGPFGWAEISCFLQQFSARRSPSGQGYTFCS